MSMNGSLVHFVLADGPESGHGQCRPALVVREFGELLVNLIIFRDGYNDRRQIEVGKDGAMLFDDSLMEWRTSVHYAHPKEFGTWHRPEDCGTQEPHLGGA